MARDSWLRRMLVISGAVTGAAAATGWAAYRLAERSVRPKQPQLALARGHRLLRRSRRVLVVAGRWDDIELLIGGTLRLLARAGSQIAIAGPGPAPIASTWQDVADTYELLPEELPTDSTYSPAVQKALKALWADVDPDTVLTFDPVFPAPMLHHPGHELVGHAVLDLILAGASPAVDLLTFATRRANVLLDIGPVLQAKLDAVARTFGQDRSGTLGQDRPGTLGQDRPGALGPTRTRTLREARAPTLREAGARTLGLTSTRLLGRLYGRAAGVACGEGLRHVRPAGTPLGHQAARE